jgi:hypothetical protein
MKFKKALIEHLNGLFQYNVCRGGRNKESVIKLLSSKYGHSETSILPVLGEVEFDHLNDSQDTIKVVYDDFTIEFTITWEMASNQRDYVVKSIKEVSV